MTVEDTAVKKARASIGLTLSGGGSRAIAYHLGCLRALKDRGILDQVYVISSVSGGSVIAGLYAYNDEPFEEFDARIVNLLKIGLTSAIFRSTVLSPELPKILFTFATSGIAALVCDIARGIVGLGRLFGVSADLLGRMQEKLQAPLRRVASRTTAFERALDRELFHGAKIREVRRPTLDVVINATELRTGTAFRFGSQETGSWRYGLVNGNDISVAKAVAASAAYPAFLPALDQVFEFTKQGEIRRERVILTDGGVYDNLGVTCLEPGRSPDFDTNVFRPRYIICCDAGIGEFAGTLKPYWWYTRMAQAFETTFRVVQTGAFKRLHNYVDTGELSGFVLTYLGQQDHALPYRPPDLVPREEVINYPTNFSAMTEQDICRISLRSEQLTRLLISRYCPKL